MRNVKISALIGKGIDRTKLILFRPFSSKKWLCLLFIALLAGALGSNSNVRGGGGGREEEKMQVTSQRQTVIDQMQQVRNEQDAQEAAFQQASLSGAVSRGISPGGTGALITAIAISLLVILLALIFTWLGARFRFVWYESIIKDDASIKEPFRKYREEGNSLFKLILLILFSFIVFGLVVFNIGFFIASAAGVFKKGFEWTFAKGFSIFIIPASLALVGIIAYSLAYFFMNHFMVPIMAMDKSPFKPACVKFMNILKNNKKDFFIYFLAIMGMVILTSIITLILSLIATLLIALAAIIVFGLAYLLLVMLLKAQIIFTILAIIAGIPFFIMSILAVMSIGLPFAVFYRSFSLYFLTSLNCGYAPLPLEEETPPPLLQPEEPLQE